MLVVCWMTLLVSLTWSLFVVAVAVRCSFDQILRVGGELYNTRQDL